MKRSFCLRICAPVCVMMSSLAAGSAIAVDGVIEISQIVAVAGGVTAGDTAGFPVTLSESGSYRLTSSLVVDSENTTVIQFTADNIVLDLNGFSIIGPSVSPSAPLVGTGMGIDGAGSNGSTVRNGTVRGVGSGGVSLGEVAHINDVTADLTGGVGIAALAGSVLRDNVVKDSQSNSIECTAAVVRSNVILRSQSNGIFANNCMIAENTLLSGIGWGLARNGNNNTSSYHGNYINSFDMGAVQPVVDLYNMGHNYCETSGGVRSTCPALGL